MTAAPSGTSKNMQNSASERGTTALMQAADQGHADVLKALIQRGANVAAVSKPVLRDGRSAARARLSKLGKSP